MLAKSALALLLLGSVASAQGDSSFGSPQAEQRMRDYVSVWEGNERSLAQGVSTYYAERVIYYGKSMTRSQVLADKLRFHRTYPDRSYDIAPGSLRTNCQRGACQARAELRWSRTHASGRQESGSSDLRLVFSPGDGGRIVRESARSIDRLRR